MENVETLFEPEGLDEELLVLDLWNALKDICEQRVVPPYHSIEILVQLSADGHLVWPSGRD